TDDERVEVGRRHQRANAVELLVVSGPGHHVISSLAAVPTPRGASCQERTGLHRMPIHSISPSIISPGRRHREAAFR
ncbi:MAG: hypothetical protein U0R69_17235, partial [Gaiellales bacterium]